MSCIKHTTEYRTIYLCTQLTTRSGKRQAEQRPRHFWSLWLRGPPLTIWNRSDSSGDLGGAAASIGGSAAGGGQLDQSGTSILRPTSLGSGQGNRHRRRHRAGHTATASGSGRKRLGESNRVSSGGRGSESGQIIILSSTESVFTSSSSCASALASAPVHLGFEVGPKGRELSSSQFK